MTALAALTWLGLGVILGLVVAFIIGRIALRGRTLTPRGHR